MLIELLGPPGVGKSTIAYELARSEDWEFQQIQSTVDLTGFLDLEGELLPDLRRHSAIGVEYLRKPRLVFLLLRAHSIGQSGPVLSRINNLAVRSSLLRKARNRGASLLLGEGTLGALCLLYAESVDWRLFLDMWKMVEVPDRVLVVEGKIGDNVERIRARGDFWSNKPYNQIEVLIRRYLQASEFLQQELRFHGIPVETYRPGLGRS